ncbi:hypothetical protein ACFOOK_28015 [Micromonospora krabiensis]|uniref:Uncharacterized protein n=1 Tax=Micromonospora krabiensis TaxID=307121 RepID=A0A1C3N4S6_9ACTN|nr:hypothetical protein [Micromonospora krabiensis]SBV27584.1 hypothetical protein GA0070620_3108 [Micromonospora krabiensis]
MRVTKYAKTIVAGIVAGGTALTVALGDDVLTATEGITVALAVLGAFGVYVVPNAKDTDVR